MGKGKVGDSWKSGTLPGRRTMSAQESDPAGLRWGWEGRGEEGRKEKQLK